MLGHKVFQVLGRRIPDTWCTVRGPSSDARWQRIDLFRGGNVIGDLDVADCSVLERLLSEHRPKVIVNCIGVIKQRPEAMASIPSIAINALLPHRLADLCQRWGGRLIHISTDCVFRGDRGSYSEEDFADATDLYGRTKFLGEVSSGNTLTLRTSFIGRELKHFNSLLEWLLSQNHKKIVGYTQALYSGVTSNYLAELVARIIEQHAELSGLYQVTGPTISKFELLGLLRDAFGLDLEIVPDDKFFCDRSMKGDKFLHATGHRCPPWPALIAQLGNDTTPYNEWRGNAQQDI